MPVIDSKPIVIRLANPQDRAAIIKLEKKAIGTLCRDNYAPQEIKAITQNITQICFNDEIVLVAEKDDYIIGFASLLSYRKLLRTLYVDPQFVNEKIVTRSISVNIHSQLLIAIEQEAIKHKIQILRVTSSLKEKAFYHAQGYQEIGLCYLSQMDLLVPGIAMQKKLISVFPSSLLWQYCLQVLKVLIPNSLFLLFFL